MERMFDSGDSTSGGDSRSGAHAVVAALQESVEGFGEVSRDIRSQLSGIPGSDLLSVLRSIESLRRNIDSISVAVLGEVSARRSTDLTEGMTPGSWLAREGGFSRSEAGSRAKTARKLRFELEEVAKALDEGRIGYQHAKVLADAAIPRILDEWTKIVGELIDMVPTMTFNSWRRHVLLVASLLDQDGGHQPGDDITDNRLRLSPTWQGALVVKGQLGGENAAVVTYAIERRADEIFHRMKRDQKLTADLEVPPRATLMALALVELVREGLAAEAGAGKAPKPEVSLVVNADDPAVVTDDRGVRIGGSGRSTLMCDPIFRPIVMGMDGVVLDVGREHRFVTNAQRIAMAHRDGGCVWPGCENPPSWTDAHHRRHWEDGGPTDMANLASLCRYHHGVTHRDGWSMHATEDQWFWWVSPSGDAFWSQRHGRQRTGPVPRHASRDRGRSRQRPVVPPDGVPEDDPPTCDHQRDLDRSGEFDRTYDRPPNGDPPRRGSPEGGAP